MKYVICMTKRNGQSKTIVLEADNIKQAESEAAKKFPNYTVGRISSNRHEVDFFNNIKGMKNG
tara:strand:+ start:2993 stop:3181 length:189 start_codon:yes stop_codon:yes gene_type:complete